MNPVATFQEVVNAAVADMAQHGFDSQSRLDRWQQAIRTAAIGSLVPEAVLSETLRQTFKASFDKYVDGPAILKANRGVSRYTIASVKPKLRAELDRRILASSNLIRLNRSAAIEKTLQRFSGWSTSIPIGGSADTKARKKAAEVKKSMGQLPFEERRVLIDQGHKLLASIDDIVAVDGGAIAGIWRSRWRQPGYDYRETHKHRDGRVYMVRGNWAQQRGLVKVGPAGYTDMQTMPAMEIFCRCKYQYLYNLRDIPAEMLTKKGRDELARVRVAA